jgi:hypothetical protein
VTTAELNQLGYTVQDGKAVRIDAAPKPGKHIVTGTHDPLAKLNKTERAYAALLDGKRDRGEIRDYRVQALTFLLAPDCRYTPDFNVVERDGTLTNIDTKGGFTREDAVLKLKFAAERFPWFRWQMIERRKGTWNTVRDLNAPA